jgi:uncharacterized protein YjbI with pentapeptide repeats
MSVPSHDHRRDLLRADCTNCFALCCAALAFQRSADFAIDKPAGEPCVNLETDFRCGIHNRLRPSGFKGCTVFDCFGAGQKVSQSTYQGVSWRERPSGRAEMFAVFPIMRDLHELLWYLEECRSLQLERELATEIQFTHAAIVALLELTPNAILDLHLNSHRAVAAELFGRVSDEVRSRVARPWRKATATREVAPRANLMGKSFAELNLRGADLRGALLIAADLRGSDLTAANLIGADLRDAQLHGTHLADALFLTQQQVNAAHGDTTTTLPTAVTRPSHWI